MEGSHKIGGAAVVRKAGVIVLPLGPLIHSCMGERRARQCAYPSFIHLGNQNTSLLRLPTTHTYWERSSFSPFVLALMDTGALFSLVASSLCLTFLSSLKRWCTNVLETRGLSTFFFSGSEHTIYGSSHNPLFTSIMIFSWFCAAGSSADSGQAFGLQESFITRRKSRFLPGLACFLSLFSDAKNTHFILGIGQFCWRRRCARETETGFWRDVCRYIPFSGMEMESRELSKDASHSTFCFPVMFGILGREVDEAIVKILVQGATWPRRLGARSRDGKGMAMGIAHSRRSGPVC
jgi:hypothetical protein